MRWESKTGIGTGAVVYLSYKSKAPSYAPEYLSMVSVRELDGANITRPGYDYCTLIMTDGAGNELRLATGNLINGLFAFSPEQPIALYQPYEVYAKLISPTTSNPYEAKFLLLTRGELT